MNTTIVRRAISGPCHIAALGVPRVQPPRRASARIGGTAPDKVAPCAGYILGGIAEADRGDVMESRDQWRLTSAVGNSVTAVPVAGRLLTLTPGFARARSKLGSAICSSRPGCGGRTGVLSFVSRHAQRSSRSDGPRNRADGRGARPRDAGGERPSSTAARHGRRLGCGSTEGSVRFRPCKYAASTDRQA